MLLPFLRAKPFSHPHRFTCPRLFLSKSCFQHGMHLLCVTLSEPQCLPFQSEGNNTTSDDDGIVGV